MAKSPTARRLLTAAPVLWTVFIFGQSLLPGSVSSGESGAVLRWITSLFDHMGWGMWVTEHLIRKTAHFAEYAVLGVLVLLAVHAWGRLRRQPTLLLFVGLLVPVLDESLQLLIDGRAGLLSDVLLDFSGVLTGMAAALLILWLRRRARRKNTR